MVTSLRAAALGFTFTLGIAAIAVAQDHPAAGLSIPQSSLTDAEQARAIALAEPQATISVRIRAASRPRRATPAPTASSSPMCRRSASTRPASGSRSSRCYQYEGNVTVNRLVDLNSGRVVEEDRIQNGGARFTNVEQEYARATADGATSASAG